MRNLIIALFILTSSNSSIAQQHFSKGVSVSIGKYIKPDVLNLTVYYHLNSFNELRFNVHNLKEVIPIIVEPLPIVYDTSGVAIIPDTTIISDGEFDVRSNLIGLDYVIGFKPKKVLSSTIYLGAGALLGKQNANKENAHPSKNLYGLNLLAEYEFAPFPLFSVGLQYNYMLINSPMKRPHKLSLKARIYLNRR